MALKLSKKATEAQPTNRFQELLEYLPLLRQGIYSTLTEAKPEEKGSLENVLGVLGQYHQLKDGLNPEISRQLGNEAAEKEIYAKAINFLMNYVEHRFKTTNNPGIWLSDSFLKEYDLVHGTLQELSRRHSPTKAFPLVYQFLTRHDHLLEQYLIEVKPQIERMDEKLFREVHILTTLSVLNDETSKVENKLKEYRAFTTTYSFNLFSTLLVSSFNTERVVKI